jgi:tRNA-specific 2-thiouridylase
VAQQLGIVHHVFNFSDDFDERVVAPYVADHAAGRTPNPCIECNRHLKFDRLLERADRLGFDAVATGHHVRLRRGPTGRFELRRAADRAKDQSYVLHMLGQEQLARCRFPVGELTKAEVRERAAAVGLRTAAKPDSQEVCFITSTGGRTAFLEPRMALHAGRVVDTAGNEVGAVDAVELVTVGQRRGLGGGGGTRRYAIAVDTACRTVLVGDEDDLLTGAVRLTDVSWLDGPVSGDVLAQCSAHGVPREATFDRGVVRFRNPERRVAPGQSVVLYRGDVVLGGGRVA